MKPKYETPYNRLIGAVREWRNKVRYPARKMLWLYPKDRLDEAWPIRNLYERVIAANTLGWDVVLTTDERGLLVQYVKRPDDINYLV